MSKSLVKIVDVLWFQEGPGVRNYQYTDSGVKLLNVANFVDGHIDLSTSSRYVSEEEAYGKYRHFLVDEGDFIIASSGIQVSYFDKKMGFVTKEQLPLCMNTSTIRFKTLDASKLNMKYFMYYLKSYHFKAQLSKFLTGSAQLNFGPSHLKRMFMPLPSLDEQQAIVRELDGINRLIDLQEEQLREYDRLAQSLFYSTFGDPATNPKGWEVKKLGDIADTYRGLTYSKKDEADISSKKVLRSNNIDLLTHSLDLEDVKCLREDFSIPDDKKLKKDSIFICMSNGSMQHLGKVAYIDRDYDYAFGGFMGLIIPSKSVSARFVFHTLLSPAFLHTILKEGRGANINNLKFSDIEKFPVPLPPLALQQTFAAQIEAIEQQKALIRRSLDETRTLLAARMQYYFN